MNPREDKGRFLPPTTQDETRTHRILRRGIPFGRPFAEDPNERRGLHFLAYQSSLDDQFEVLQRRWANVGESGDFSPTKPYRAGWDPLIGRHPANPDDPRGFRLRSEAQPDGQLFSLEPWAHPVGGGYFLCPSIRAITRLAEGRWDGTLIPTRPGEVTLPDGPAAS